MSCANHLWPQAADPARGRRSTLPRHPFGRTYVRPCLIHWRVKGPVWAALRSRGNEVLLGNGRGVRADVIGVGVLREK